MRRNKGRPEDRKLNAALRRRIRKARNFPSNTSSDIRHLEIIADVLGRGKQYPGIQEDPLWIAGTMLSVIAGLYEARNKIARLESGAAEPFPISGRRYVARGKVSAEVPYAVYSMRGDDERTIVFEASCNTMERAEALATALNDAQDLQRSFDLRWKADMRAIKRWRKERPEERKLRMPDHADLCVWLLRELEAAEKRARRP